MPGEAEAIKKYEKHPAGMPLYIRNGGIWIYETQN